MTRFSVKFVYNHEGIQTTALSIHPTFFRFGWAYEKMDESHSGFIALLFVFIEFTHYKRPAVKYVSKDVVEGISTEDNDKTENN